MPFVTHQMHGRICPAVVGLQLWKFEIWGIAGIPDFLSERVVIGVIHVVLVSAASREALNEIGELIAPKKLLQIAKIRAGAPSVECRRGWKLSVGCQKWIVMCIMRRNRSSSNHLQIVI